MIFLVKPFLGTFYLVTLVMADTLKMSLQLKGYTK